MVRGELLQDFKVGYTLGGTPRTIQIVELIAVICASLVMYFPLLVRSEERRVGKECRFGMPRYQLHKRGLCLLFFSSRRRHTSSLRDWSSDVCSSDLSRRSPRSAPRSEWSAASCCRISRLDIFWAARRGPFRSWS